MTARWAPRPRDAALVGGVVLATVGVASAADAVARHRRASGRAVISASRVPWRSAVLALAGAGAISAYRGGSGFDAVTAAFPLAAVGAAAIVVSAVATALLSRLVRRWLPRRLGPRLTLSRLARDPASATAFLAATVAFGAAGYGLLFHASADDATTDKVATAVGANSVFGVGDPVAAAEPRRRRRRVDHGAPHHPADQRLHRATACTPWTRRPSPRPRSGRRGSPAASCPT